MTAGEAPGKGKSKVGRRSPSGGPELYDFRRPAKLGREHARSLQLVFEAFARQYTSLLTSTLRSACQVGLVSIDQLTYEEYVAQLSNPTLMVLLEVDPMPGVGVLEFSVGAAMTCVDHLLGGPGTPNQPARPLTDIEHSLLRDLLGRVLGELRNAFSELLDIEPRIVGIEYNPQFAQIAGPSDVVVVASFDMRVGQVETVATVLLPFAPTLAALEAKSGTHLSTGRERLLRERAAQTIAARMEDVPVEVTVRFDTTITRPEDLAALAPGDVVTLRHATTHPLTVRAADVVFAHASPGAAGKRLAVLVVDPPPAEDGPPRIVSHRPLPAPYDAPKGTRSTRSRTDLQERP